MAPGGASRSFLERRQIVPAGVGPFVVTLGANIGVRHSADFAAVTLDIVDVHYTAAAVTLVGADLPVNPNIGELTLNTGRSDGQDGYVFSTEGSDVTRDTDGGLRYNVAVGVDTLEEAVATIAISRGESGGEDAVSALSVTVSLKGCYRTFRAASIGGGLSAVEDVVALSAFDVFLHRSSDNAYLLFDEINGTDVVFADGAVLAPGNVLSVVPAGADDDAVKNAANFHRVYEETDGVSGVNVMRLTAPDPATAPCSSNTVILGLNFYLDEDWVRTNLRRESRLTFAAPLTDGTVMRPPSAPGAESQVIFRDATNARLVESEARSGDAGTASNPYHLRD